MVPPYLIGCNRNDCRTRLMRPTVGLMATSIVWLAGVKIEPDVSVPTFAAQKFAAVPAPSSTRRH